MSAEALYLTILGLFLGAFRSPWPWTRLGGLAIVVASLGGAVLSFSGEELRGLVIARFLPVTVLASLSASVVWWSLHSGGQLRRSPEEGDDVAPRQSWHDSGRVWGVALGVGAVALAAILFEVPADPPDVEEPGASPWFLAGLAALGPIVGELYAWWLVPAAALLGLLLAPGLDSHDPDAQAPFAGRRDEVPFFLFAWLAVGVIPIVVATLRPDFGAMPAPSLADRLWGDAVGMTPPRAWLLRELPGLLLYLLFFGLLPRQLAGWRATRGVFARHLRRLGHRKYYLVTTLVGILVLVPVKVGLFWLLGFGPWLAWEGGG